MSLRPKKRTQILLLDDGRAGHLHQSEALVESLIKAQIKTSIDNCVSAFEVSRIGLSAAESLPRTECMTLLVGCGRRAARCSASMKKRFGIKLNNIQILNPVVKPKLREQSWEWLLLPRHDQQNGPNIITFLGSLVKTPPPFSAGEPHLLLLFGGATDYLCWDESSLNAWLEQAKSSGKAVTLCPSRRTPTTILDSLQSQVLNNPNWSLIASDDSVAFRQAQAEASEFWVTADSINMLAEACASDRPVRALGKEQASGKVKRYLGQLEEIGRFEHCHLIREADRVALELIKRGALLGL